MMIELIQTPIPSHLSHHCCFEFNSEFLNDEKEKGESKKVSKLKFMIGLEIEKTWRVRKKLHHPRFIVPQIKKFGDELPILKNNFTTPVMLA